MSALKHLHQCLTNTVGGGGGGTSCNGLYGEAWPKSMGCHYRQNSAILTFVNGASNFVYGAFVFINGTFVFVNGAYILVYGTSIFVYGASVFTYVASKLVNGVSYFVKLVPLLS